MPVGICVHVKNCSLTAPNRLRTASIAVTHRIWRNTGTDAELLSRESPWRSMPNALVLPHIASSTRQSFHRQATSP